MTNKNKQYAPWSEDEDDPHETVMTKEESAAAAEKVARRMAREKARAQSQEKTRDDKR
jgi:hypothetical protein